MFWVYAVLNLWTPLVRGLRGPLVLANEMEARRHMLQRKENDLLADKKKKNELNTIF